MAHFSHCFLALSHYLVYDNSNITLLAFMMKWKMIRTVAQYNNIKVFRSIDYGFHGFDTPFLRNLLFLPFFTFSFYSYETSWMMTSLNNFSRTNQWAYVPIWNDTWWLSWLWKESFSKYRKNQFNFAFLYFFVYFSRTHDNCRSHMIILFCQAKV